MDADDRDDAALTSDQKRPPTGTTEGTGGPMDPTLSQQVVWYRLMKLTNLLSRPFFARFAEKYEMSINEWRIIITLANMGEAAAHELCEAIGMHPMNVSRSVAILRNQGRVKERRDPDNRRRKILSLTPEGWAVCNALTPHVKKVAEFLFDSMTPLEVEFLSKLIDLLIERLQSVDPEDPIFFDPQALAQEDAKPES